MIWLTWGFGNMTRVSNIDIFEINPLKHMAEDYFLLNTLGIQEAKRKRPVTKTIKHVRQDMLAVKINELSSSNKRQMVLCEYDVGGKITYFWADNITGTMYRARNGRCVTSDMMEIV